MWMVQRGPVEPNAYNGTNMDAPEDLIHQLRDVFDLCDEDKTGYISINHLLQLGRKHIGGGSQQDVERLVQVLDPSRRGLISFEDFCQGVATALQIQGSAASSSPFGRQEEVTRTIQVGCSSVAPMSSSRSFLVAPKMTVEAPPSPPPTMPPPPSSCSPPSLTDADSALGSTASPDTHAKSNSQCSSMSDREENFECYGEGDELDIDAADAADNRGEDDASRSPSQGQGPFIRRNTWLRTSLRRSPSHNNEHLPQRRWGSFRHSSKRLGSNALASQLYRSASFNSSGRSSNCDGDDMYSDVSLEDDVLDLNHKVQLLQQQVTALAENQNNSDDRYNRVKQENAALTARIHMLEEQLREVEQRSEERVQEEQRRHRELMTRVEREKQLEIENYVFRLESMEKEQSRLSDESGRLRFQLEKSREDKSVMGEQLSESESSLSALHEEHHRLQELSRREKEGWEQERAANVRLMSDLSHQVDGLRRLQEDGEEGKSRATRARSPSVTSETTAIIQHLEREVHTLRDETRALKEANEELQAQLLNHGLEEGRHLLTGAAANNSLAAEFEAMTHDQVKGALKEQQEVNAQLRAYIDGILLNIVENHPQLLEVKRKK